MRYNSNTYSKEPRGNKGKRTQTSLTLKSVLSDSSNEDNIILQDNSKAAPSVTANVKGLTDDAAQEEPIYKGPRTSKRQKKPPTIKSDNFLR